MAGYVYLIGSPSFNWYKIGKSKTPDIRIKDIGVLLPFKVEIFAIWKADNHTLVESILHEKYAANRINGEWFLFTWQEVQKLIFEDSVEMTTQNWHYRIFPGDGTPVAAFTNILKDAAPEGKRVHLTYTKIGKEITKEALEKHDRKGTLNHDGLQKSITKKLSSKKPLSRYEETYYRTYMVNPPTSDPIH
jgi:hypothetical protein